MMNNPDIEWQMNLWKLKFGIPKHALQTVVFDIPIAFTFYLIAVLHKFLEQILINFEIFDHSICVILNLMKCLIYCC